jgi:hypothetical protein
VICCDQSCVQNALFRRNIPGLPLLDILSEHILELRSMIVRALLLNVCGKLFGDSGMTSRHGRGLSAAIAIAAVLSGLTGCDNQNSDIFRAPRNEASDEPFPPPEVSSVRLLIRIPFEGLMEGISSRLPATQELGGSTRLACIKVPYVIGPHAGSHRQCAQVPYLDFRGAGTQEQCINVPDITGPSIGQNDQCVDANWHATVTREGNASVSRSDDAVHVALPIRIDGAAGFSGDLARLFSLAAKNFEVHANPQVDVRLGLTQDWCPEINVTPTNNWVTSATIEAIGQNCLGIDLGPLGHPQVCVGPANLDVTSQTNQAVSQQEGQIAAAASSALSCDSARTSVMKVWHNYSLPLGHVGDDEAYLNIEPKGAAVSDFSLDDTGIVVALEARAITQVSSATIDESLLDLPQLQKTDDTAPGGAKLIVRTTAPYELLNQLLAKALKGRDFAANTSAGKASVHVNDTTVYPSGDALAVGVNVSAKLPGRFLDTNGWVYLTGRPVIMDNGRGVRIDDLKYAEVLDNASWKLIVTVFNDQILALLKSRSELDLTPQIEQAKDQIRKGISGINVPKIHVQGGEPDVALNEVRVGQDGFIASVAATMPLEVSLEADAFAQP